MAQLARPQTQAPADRDFVRPEARKFVLAAAIIGSALGFIDGTVVAIAMASIRADLGISLSQATWIQNAYMVTLSALILTGGAIGDRFGLARVFSIGICLFVTMSLVCAVAPNASVLIMARAAQGIGAAMMVPGALSLVARAYPRAERGAAIGIWAAASGITTAIGPLIGSVALSLGGDAMWRWIFAINLPLGILAIALLWRAVDRDSAKPDEKIDVLGAVLASAGLGLMAWALTGAEGGPGSAASIAFGLLGLGCLVGFVTYQSRIEHGMLPLSLFKSHSFSMANLATFALYFGMSAVLFFLPMLVIAGWGLSELIATFAFAPLSAFIFILSGWSGRMADRIGPGPMIAAGAMVVAAAYLWLGFGVQTTAFWTGVIPPMILGGVGMGLVVAPLSTAIMIEAEDGQTGAASGVNNAVSRIGGLFSVAAMGTLAGTTYRAAGGTVSYGLASTAPGHVEAMNAAFSTVTWACAGLAFIAAAIAALGVKRGPKA